MTTNQPRHENPQRECITLDRTHEWREKAIKRADEQREQRKVSKRHRETIAELKLKIEDLKQELKEVGAKKKSARAQR
jgi:phage shock protein A